jgi:outer membrane biosynthesis protein TonB
MNGQFFPPSFGPRLNPDTGMIRLADLKRLVVALTLSCLLHAGLFFVPYLGVSTSPSRPAAQGRQNGTLNATLALEKHSAFAEASPVSTERQSVAKAAADRMAGEEARAASDRAVGIGLLPIPAPTYYTTDRLTKRPQPTAEAELDTPETWPIAASGTIILKLWISEFGDVVSADVEKTDLPELFSRTAVAAFRNLRFVPGEIDGRRVRTVMRIEVIYSDNLKPP